MGKRNEKANLKSKQNEIKESKTNNDNDNNNIQLKKQDTTVRSAKQTKKGNLNTLNNNSNNKNDKSLEGRKSINKENSKKQSKNKKTSKNSLNKEKEDLKFLSLLDEDEESNYELKANYDKVLKEVSNNSEKLVNENQISKAVSCIKKYIKSSFDSKQAFDLLSSENESFIYLNFVLGKVPNKYSLRPNTIPLTNPLYLANKDKTRVCLIVKDPRSAIKDLNIEFPFKVKIIDIEKLKLKYSRFNERRDLIKEYDLFLCDYKVYLLLKKHLGKPFYDAKKYPVPTKINPSDKDSILREVVSKVTTGTTFYMSNGPNYSLKVGRLTQSEKDIEQNVKDALKGTLPHLLKWNLDLSA